jgi:hypothetical protein
MKSHMKISPLWTDSSDCKSQSDLRDESQSQIMVLDFYGLGCFYYTDYKL